jgi:hypothetical protein
MFRTIEIFELGFDGKPKLLCPDPRHQGEQYRIAGNRRPPVTFLLVGPQLFEECG